jgi:ATP-dependent exoDNAse (exonuclease V) beta subunit
MSSTPSHYSKELPRVSSICEAFYKFNGTPEELFFENWLGKNGITREEYMEEACRAGTWVHNKVEQYVKTGKLPKRGRESKLVREAARFIHDKELTELQPEVYVRTKYFQGTCDLMAKDKNGKVVIADWKTWGAAKWKWKLNYDYRRNQHKIDKVKFQMSLYSFGLHADKAYGVELRDDGYKAYYSKPYNEEFIENLMKAYEASLR